MKKRAILFVILALALCGCGSRAEDKAEDPDDKAPENVITIDDDAEEEEDQEDTGESEALTFPEDSMEEDLLSSDEEDEASDEDAEDMTGRDLFADFVMGKGLAGTSKDCLFAINLTETDIKPGSEFTLSELEEYFRKDSMIGNTNPKVSYAPLTGTNGLFALQLLFEAEPEVITETMIFNDNGKKLELIFAIDSWSRRYAAVSDRGAVFDDGSNGAGSHSYVTYAPDKDLIYRKVSDLDEEYYGFGFYDEKGEDEEPINTIMNEAGEGNEKAQTVAYYREVINGRPYYYFLGGKEKLTQDTVDHIDKVAASHDFKFDGKQSADEARSAYEKKLGAEGISEDKTGPRWKDM